MLVVATPPVPAQVSPPARQSADAADGADGSGFARLPAGSADFVDPTVGNACRYAVNGNQREIVIPVSTVLEWQYFRAGEDTGQPPPGVSETVCCRPQSPNAGDGFCALGGSPSGFTPASLPYAKLADTVPVGTLCIQTCHDNQGQPYSCNYSDSVTYVCGQQGAGVMADGLWNAGGQTEVCSPSAHATTGSCSAGCGWGSALQTVYDGCGQIQSQTWTSCWAGSCCTPDWQTNCGACNQSTGQKTCTTYDANYCPGSSGSSYSQQCAWTVIGGASCTVYSYAGGMYGNCYKNDLSGYCVINGDGCGCNFPNAGDSSACFSTWSTWGDADINTTTNLSSDCAVGAYQQTAWCPAGDYCAGLPIAYSCWGYQ